MFGNRQQQLPGIHNVCNLECRIFLSLCFLALFMALGTWLHDDGSVARERRRAHFLKKPVSPPGPECLHPKMRERVEKNKNGPRYFLTKPADAREYQKAHSSGPFKVLGLGERNANITEMSVPMSDGENIRCRLYRPLAATQAPLPVLVFYHGGGWVFRDIEEADWVGRYFSNAVPCAVFSVEYRKAPEYPYPRPTFDAFEAYHYVFQIATQYGLDVTRVAVGGESAGGNLAAAVSLLALKEAMKGRIPMLQVLWYPVTNYAFETDSYHLYGGGDVGLGRMQMMWYWDQFLFKGAHFRPMPESEANSTNVPAEPLPSGPCDWPACVAQAPDRLLKQIPPTLLIVAACDVLRDDSWTFAERLLDVKANFRVSEFPGMPHGFVKYADSIDQSKKAVEEITATLRLYMKS